MMAYPDLIEQFKNLSHEDKYDKLIVYLHAAQKSEENLIGICLLIASLGPDLIEDDVLIELYDAFVSFVEYDDDRKIKQAERTISMLQNLKEQEQHERFQEKKDIEDMLNNI